MRKIIFTLLAIVALSLPAAAKDTLTIYTYSSFTADWGPGAKIKAAFEKTCDCEVNYVALGDGVAMLNRLKLEGKDTKADVVLGLDTNLTAEAKATGLFGKSGVDSSGATVPGGWSDDTFVPYDYGHFAVIYDTQAIKEMYYEGDGAELTAKKSVNGALMLYLDFINIFQSLLYLMGNRNN